MKDRCVKPFDRVWHWRQLLPERKGHACRVLQGRSSNGSILVEFTDGHQVVTSRWAVRRQATAGPAAPAAPARRRAARAPAATQEGLFA